MSNDRTRTLDIGCGTIPRNPFNAEEVYGVDVKQDLNKNIHYADLAIERLPFPSDYFNYTTAFDFLEHIPRLIYSPVRRYSFVEVMNEVHRVLVLGGIFLSFTPAAPKLPAFSDPTHVNIITEETFPQYFCLPACFARLYGFNGTFELISQEWRENHLLSIMRKISAYNL